MVIVRSAAPSTRQRAGRSSSRTTWSPEGTSLLVNTPASALTVPLTPAGSTVTLNVIAETSLPLVVTPTVTVPVSGPCGRRAAAHAEADSTTSAGEAVRTATPSYGTGVRVNPGECGLTSVRTARRDRVC